MSEFPSDRSVADVERMTLAEFQKAGRFMVRAWATQVGMLKENTAKALFMVMPTEQQAEALYNFLHPTSEYAPLIDEMRSAAKAAIYRRALRDLARTMRSIRKSRR